MVGIIAPVFHFTLFVLFIPAVFCVDRDEFIRVVFIIINLRCFDKDAQHKLGDLKNQSFKELWHNGNYSQFRSKVLQSRKNIDICANCSEGVKVWG